MHSAKLKKLLLDEVPLKFRIKDEQSFKEVKDFLINIDMHWDNNSEPRYLDDVNFLYVHDGIIFKGKYERFFVEHHAKEFDIENDCLVEEKTEEKDISRSISFADYLINPSYTVTQIIGHLELKLSEVSALLELIKEIIKKN